MFPETVIHQCVVHLVRQSVQYVSWGERKEVTRALRAIYQAPSEPLARQALQTFAASPLGQRHAPIVALWERVAPALQYPMAIRRVLYTTTAIESLWHAKPDKYWRAAFPHLKILFGDRLQDV